MLNQVTEFSEQTPTTSRVYFSSLISYYLSIFFCRHKNRKHEHTTRRGKSHICFHFPSSLFFLSLLLIMVTLYSLLILFLQICLLPLFSLKCSWEKRENAPEVYFINMDKSQSRKQNMIDHYSNVGLKSIRIRGIVPKQEIYIPSDLLSTWPRGDCKIDTDVMIPQKSATVNNSSSLSRYSYIIRGLCGRGKKKNSLKELGCTSSHLLAMRAAIMSPHSKSKYAIITEDDVFFPFDIDFDALAKSAPKDFGILQLFNSNQASMEYTWKLYIRSQQKNLWVRRQPMRFFDFWSTCAYLINKDVMKSVLERVAYEQDGWMNFKIVAGFNSNPCVPKRCCVNGTDKFIHQTPCVWAPRGFQADSFLYAMTTTYMLAVPLISNGLGGNESTFHQEHVEMLHRGAFKRQREYINEMLSGKVKPPIFARAACNQIDELEL